MKLVSLCQDSSKARCDQLSVANKELILIKYPCKQHQCDQKEPYSTMDITLSATPRMKCSLRSICCNISHHPKRVKRPHNISFKPMGGSRVDRWEVLLVGLGGATGGLATHQGALAAPIQASDLRNCNTPNTVPGDTNCCPPYRPTTM